MEFTNSDLLIKLLGIFISFFGVIVPLYKFITEKNLSQRDLRFKTYHLLIKVSSINSIYPLVSDSRTL